MASALTMELAPSGFELRSRTAKKILLIEHDHALRPLLQRILFEEDYEVNVVPDVPVALDTLRQQDASMVILILGETESFNRDYCKEVVRAAPRTPFMVLTSKPDLFEKILLLDIGVDDYMGIPFNPMEFAVRVRALIRRTSTPGPRTIYSFGEFTVNFLTMEVVQSGRKIVLTNKEFHVLKYMVKNANRVISRDELLNQVWGFHCYPSTRTVDNHILKLRQKLERHPSRPTRFLTVHGIGYRFTF